jgi:hypothetical protein
MRQFTPLLRDLLAVETRVSVGAVETSFANFWKVSPFRQWNLARSFPHLERGLFIISLNFARCEILND